MAYADGDARRLLNTLETLSVAAGAEKLDDIDDDWLLRVLGERMRRYDKGGEQFYDTISALHKSVRGSDPDAALYWFVRMLDGGADPRYMARRLVRMASEDIGLADPRALRLALDAAEVYERLGSPEGELALAECVVYLAIAPKSNAVYKAYNEVQAFIKQDGTRPVPLHLRNAPTQLMKQLDYGKGYRYAHDEEGGFAAGERYLPDGLEPPALLRAGRARPRDPHRARSCANCASATKTRRLIRSVMPLVRPAPNSFARQRENPGAGAPKWRSGVTTIPATNPPSTHAGGFFAKRSQGAQPARLVRRAPTKGAAQKGILLWTSCCSRSSTVWSSAACTP